MRPQAAAMKALLDQPAMQIVPGCGDGMAARLLQEAGFAIGFASGSSIHAMRLAMPDMDLLSFPEMRDAVEGMVNAAPQVLWLADGDTGYGNAMAVQRTVREYARAGAAAVLIEDKVWPRQLAAGGAKLVVERDEALLRMRAAMQAGARRRRAVAGAHRRLPVPWLRGGAGAVRGVRGGGRGHPVPRLAGLAGGHARGGGGGWRQSRRCR